MYQISDEKKDWLSFGWSLLIFVLFCLVVLVLFYFSVNQKKYDLKVNVIESPLFRSVDATPVAMLKNKELVQYKIKILNATGETGKAAEAEKKILDKGVNVKAVLGNNQKLKGVQASFKTSALKDSILGKAVFEIWQGNKSTVIEEQSEDLVLILGN